MKILHVNDYYTPYGGVEHYILSVARLLSEHGHSNAILYTRQTNGTISVGDWPAFFVRMDGDISVQVREILTAEMPDAVYLHHVSSPVLIETLVTRLPTVAYVHGFTAVCPGLGKYYRRGDRVCTRRFGWGCVPMHYLRRCSAARRPATLMRLMRQTSALKRTLLQVPRLLVGSRYMVDLLMQNDFSEDSISILAPHFFPENISLTYTPPREMTCVVYAGRLEIEKGFPYLLRAFTRLSEKVHLLVAGDGTQRAIYERLASDLQLSGRIEFSGWLDQEAMEEVYRRCNLVVLPSICPESFGKVGVEALAHGRPVIAFDVGGIADWLEDGVNGILVAPRDVSGLANAIGELLENPQRAMALGRNGQLMVAERYCASGHLVALLEAFEKARQAYV